MKIGTLRSLVGTAFSATAMLVSGTAQASVAQELSAGYNHVCATTTTGAVYCWGSNNLGQLGNGSTVNSSLPVAVTGLSSNVAAVAAGYQHTCAVMTDGTLKCWGRNDFGQLGNNSTTNSTTPVTVAGLSGVVAVAAGTSHTCAVLSTGAMQCWGLNTSGQLGDGTTIKRLTPVAVAGVSGAVNVATGLAHTCALLAVGTVQCWGLNGDGELGNGTTVGSFTYVNVSGLTGVVSVTAGQYHTCALTSVGGAKCWGSFAYGQLGNGTLGGSGPKVSVPTDVIGLTSGVMMLTASSGGGSTCAILSTSTAQCWGYNSASQLGTGDHVNHAVPTAVSVLTGTLATMTIGGTDACAKMAAGGVQCWGNNNVGQQGAGNTVTYSFPQSVVGF